MTALDKIRIVKQIAKCSGGSVDGLQPIFTSALKIIKSKAKDESDFTQQCDDLLNSACKLMGENNRALYQDYISRTVENLK